MKISVRWPGDEDMGLNRLIVVDGSSAHQDAYKLASGTEEILEQLRNFQT
jgi:tRNA C32,U32 (ribose-2'-O)-methylase TrmJ